MSEFEWSLIELRSESLTEFFTLTPTMHKNLILPVDLKTVYPS